MKILVPAITAFGLAFASLPALAQDAAQPAPMSNPADTAKPEAAPASPPVCGPGVTDRCVQSAADERMAAKDYSDNLPHNDNAAMMHGGGKMAMKRHMRRK